VSASLTLFVVPSLWFLTLFVVSSLCVVVHDIGDKVKVFVLDSRAGDLRTRSQPTPQES
jgi:hypothetical protein